MRNGFTMVELIFIVVIIGVLAAIAIPRLNLTRSNSEGSKIAYNLSICVNDSGNTFVKTGYFSGDSTQVDKLPIASVACVNGLIPNGEINPCFIITVVDANGTLNVKNSTSTTAVCTEAQKLATKNGVGSSGGTTHKYNF